ncbi:GyrI-like domain-containing protein [Porifericola rhodea]|uniref:GyrI-like domain-containing protein n=1 Tax=Porifericola rhodea TaxID=930972 RepID=UPI0026662A3D|nr:GyrI-like domain-containing protein [Porifericola rhodea]WKN33397.1 GyrI-like domain-containing protein [Porifericola rhodea]
MHLYIEKIPGILLVGHCMQTSHQEEQTTTLWQGFMPRRKEISELSSSDLYSVEEYDEDFFLNYAPDRKFNKWAACPVKRIVALPQGMVSITIPAGLYARVHYQGKGSEAASVYQSFFQTWLPASGYMLDNRPHFARMGEKYKNEDLTSEEDLFFPIRKT